MSAIVEKIPTPEPFAALFAALGIAAQTYAHPPVFTVEAGREFKFAMPGGHTKNLFLKDKKGVVWLVTALWDTPVDLKALPSKTGGGRLSFGSPALLKDILGVTPGSVTPLALIHDTARRVRPVIDARMLAEACVNCHPLINDKATGLAPDDLLRFIRHLGYAPLVMDLS